MSRSRAIDHSGSTFDSFLEEENLSEEVETVAMKRVIAWQLRSPMKSGKVTKQNMAARLKTSRSQIGRLLDPEYVGVGLDTISKAAHALGKRVSIQFVDIRAKSVRGERAAKAIPRGARRVRARVVNG